MAPSKPKTGGPAKASNKRPGKPSSSGSKSGPPSKSKKPSGPKPAPTQVKPKAVDNRKKKPPHMKYTEKELKVPQLNGIRPAGVSKPPNAKKGKNFVDDKESMNAILAMVMAEKEGNIESKLMRARQMEEVREAKRIEAEKRTQSKKESLEDRKQNIKDDSKKRSKKADNEVVKPVKEEVQGSKKAKLRKRVSFG
jgi:60S ribosomal subunit assembly/export protein LOC1